MRGFAGSCRFVFNRALALQKELFERSIEVFQGLLQNLRRCLIQSPLLCGMRV
jgi:Helix-turn-helix domain